MARGTPYPPQAFAHKHMQREAEQPNLTVQLNPKCLAEWGREMAASAVLPVATSTAAAAAARRQRSCGVRRRRSGGISGRFRPFDAASSRCRQFSLRGTNDSNRTELSPNPATKRSEADKIVDGMSFGEICNEFECISSPSVEATARQLVRDILELREGNRALGTFAFSVKYKSPVRSFTGREKYKRPLWVTDVLDAPTVRVQEMMMLSTSVLIIKWLAKGKPKSILASIGGDLIVKVTSQFTLNQISGQVVEHEEFWNLSASSTIVQAYFWSSCRLFAIIETGKDVADFVKNLTSCFLTQNQNLEIHPDPSGDPTKFFQRDDGFQRDAYQIGLVLAVLYFVVQFLTSTL